MTREWCQKCQTNQVMLESIAEVTEKDENGKDVNVVVRSYQCSGCNSFIKSEETRTPVLGV